MSLTFSTFSSQLEVETAFSVLAVAKQLKAGGKTVIELEIGDSPYESTSSAKDAGIKAIQDNQTHYCPSPGLPEVRAGIARFVQTELDVPLTAENIVVGHGAKIFEQFFCEAILNPGDGVLVFSPYFPTYLPNILRRDARMITSALKQENAFRPSLTDIEQFLSSDESPKAIFLNSPHNPTGGVTPPEDLQAIAEMIRGRDIAVFSDEPYCHMAWSEEHASLIQQEDMLQQTVSAYTFSKSYSMSGWRLGYAVTSVELADRIAKMINTSLSCVPPLVQLAGLAALEQDLQEREQSMKKFRNKVHLLTDGLNQIDGIHTLDPAGTFYVFPNVQKACNQLGITSHGLAMYLLEGADDHFGIACLGGECFGKEGEGFIRFSCAEPDEQLKAALEFLPEALGRSDRISRFLEQHPEFQLKQRYNQQ